MPENAVQCVWCNSHVATSWSCCHCLLLCPVPSCQGRLCSISRKRFAATQLSSGKDLVLVEMVFGTLSTLLCAHSEHALQCSI